jgi:hypothetical protein
MKRFSTFISLLFCALWITACSACQHAAEAHSANTTSNSIVKAPSQDGVEQQNQVKSMEPLRETTPPIITPSSSSKRVLLVGNSQFFCPPCFQKYYKRLRNLPCLNGGLDHV